jgi:hypothetical protein
MKLLANGGLEFTRQELKELFEPIIKNFGFEYEAFLDPDKRGLVWTKQFDWAGDVTDPLMVIEESAADFVGVDYAADYFSSRLYWEDLRLFANPEEFGEAYYDDEVMSFIEGIREAQKEVNRVLIESRALLQAELFKIKAALEPINLEVAEAKKLYLVRL